MKPELTIILVNFNDKPHLENCLASLEKGTSGIASEVILVDNHSLDGSQEMVRTSFPWIRLIQNEENLGYAKANNIGIREGCGEFVLFLNTDTVIPPEALPTLLMEMRVKPRVGALGPALVHGAKKFQVSFGRKRDFSSEILQKFILNPYYKLVLKFSHRSREVGWVGGACLLTRRSVLEEVGLFEEKFFLFFEDIDLCLRIKKKGYKIIFFPRVRVFHVGAVTTSASSTRRLQTRLEYRRSQLYFYRKHSSRVSVFLLRIYLRLNFAFTFLFKIRQPEARALLRSERARIFGAENIS
jgi:GT2 family glycosyltransferase